MEDHDAIIRLEGALQALSVSVESHNIASVERDTRIEQKVDRINGTVGRHDERLGILWNDRSIWNWVTRLAILGTPIAVGIVSWLTR